MFTAINTLSTGMAVRMMTARRAAGFVEWALLAVVAVGVFAAISAVLPSFFGETIDNVKDSSFTVE